MTVYALEIVCTSRFRISGRRYPSGRVVTVTENVVQIPIDAPAHGRAYLGSIGLPVSSTRRR